MRKPLCGDSREDYNCTAKAVTARLRQKSGSRERSKYELVAIGASAGGLPALIEVIGGIDGEFPAILVVQHLDPRRKSQIPNLLTKKTGKPVKEAEDSEPLLGGKIYVGPPDEHLLVSQGRIQLAHSRLVRFSRPSIDMMFGSVAATYGNRAVGVILSGSNRDGADGITAIRRAGGVTIAQDPATAEYRVMPQAAIDTGCVDLVVPLGAIGETLSKLFTRGGDREWPTKSH